MFTIWLTGLYGAGKTTIAAELFDVLERLGHLTAKLDGDDLRFGLCRDLGFSLEDRKENVRRISEVARLMNDGGMNAIVSCISPIEEDRAEAKATIGYNNFLEVYVSTSLEVCEQRDTKHLYKQAREGKLADFTGISAPYEAPLHADIEIDTAAISAEDAALAILKTMSEKYLLTSPY